jgi:hypothetical protein
MRAAITLQADACDSWPEGLSVAEVRVEYGSDAWSPPAARLERRGDSLTREIALSGGPKWGPGEAVRVVLRLRDSAGSYRIVLDEVAIQKTQ